MKTTVLLFHPDFEHSRVNSTLSRALDGKVEVHDMYKLYPDFHIDAEAERMRLESADRIVLQFPIYWYSSPALLKQWEDVVMHAHEWAGKEMMLAVSFGSNSYGRDGFVKYTTTELLRPFQATARLTEMRYLKPYIVMSASHINDADLQRSADAYADYVTDPDVPALGDFE